MKRILERYPFLCVMSTMCLVLQKLPSLSLAMWALWTGRKLCRFFQQSSCWESETWSKPRPDLSKTPFWLRSSNFQLGSSNIPYRSVFANQARQRHSSVLFGDIMLNLAESSWKDSTFLGNSGVTSTTLPGNFVRLAFQCIATMPLDTIAHECLINHVNLLIILINWLPDNGD